jgi:formate dehydrogenase maturation protein FdhE
MDPTSGIRKLGFRKWYERELIKCHAALVTCFLCGLTVAALLEQIRFSDGVATAAGELAIVFAAVAIGWLSWRSYITGLERAERYGERSTCPACKVYGRFRVVASGPEVAASAVSPLEYAWMNVECRKCGNAWRMPG